MDDPSKTPVSHRQEPPAWLENFHAPRSTWMGHQQLDAELRAILRDTLDAERKAA